MTVLSTRWNKQQSDSSTQWRSLHGTSGSGTFSIGSGIGDGIQVQHETSGEHWTIRTRKSSIATSAQVDEWTRDLSLPMPTMVFPENLIAIEAHHAGFQLEFTAKEALRQVNNREAIPWRVQASEQWIASRASCPHTKSVVSPYDWTYSTDYRGTLITKGDAKFTCATSPKHCVDVGRLQQPEPILFYDEVVLYEDELADNGLAQLAVKVRVMPSCFLLLQRFFLRLEGGLFRVHDTRVYHEFGSQHLVRECTSRDVEWNQFRGHLEAQLDSSRLMDISWVASKLPPPNAVVTELLSTTPTTTTVL